MVAMMKGGRHRERPSPAMRFPANAVSPVLSNRDLTGAFPTDLVRAALACSVASDPIFLRRFDDLHPPRLLGFYTNAYYWWSRHWHPEFWPLHHPPELASIIRRAASIFDNLPSRVIDCRDGHLLAVKLCEEGYSTQSTQCSTRSCTFHGATPLSRHPRQFPWRDLGCVIPTTLSLSTTSMTTTTTVCHGFSIWRWCIGTGTGSLVRPCR
ncbi:hypothetical protein C2845_PM18G06720 [Panicum miliaceum]|uniref:Uncharacterized protein n=1 Tax=Panicum miliaceum TaxID=4540 RepID=A0A3L6PL36_PANMI|nr:hypothetical protein C2845_PM18G06720 [Panicum miliaceum]